MHDSGERAADALRGGPLRDLSRPSGIALHALIPVEVLVERHLNPSLTPAIQMEAMDHRRLKGWDLSPGQGDLADLDLLPMPSEDFDRWREALLSAGRIGQELDQYADPDHVSHACHRYLALLDLVKGSEDGFVLQGLLDSLQVANDNELYEAALEAVARFPGTLIGTTVFRRLSDLLERVPFRAWDLLNQIAMLTYGEEATAAFNSTWGSSSADFARRLLDAITDDEANDGWLAGERVDRLRPRVTNET
jgi:hypothetical protein